MISLADYWMGRDRTYSLSLTPAIEKAAMTMVDLASRLLESASRCEVPLTRNSKTGSLVSSGWRPPLVNSSTPNAAPNSKHMTGQAIDIYDPDGDLDEWLMTADGQSELVRLGLWMEHPSATKGWAHLQTIPPRSGNRVFYP